MPTVLGRNEFEVMIYTRDHLLCHIQVLRAGTEVIMDIDALEVRDVIGICGVDCISK